MAETTTAATTPTIAYEYIWYAGEPLAQVETANGAIHYYFNDHLGTPLLTTSATGTIDWRVEREPYGRIMTTRVGANRHQPLSFPGQEDRGDSSRSYNIYRWYRAGWGRYTQADPLGFAGGSSNWYEYGAANPLRYVDPLGLVTVNITPMATQIVDQDVLRDMVFPSGLGGQFLKGALASARSAECVCECKGNYGSSLFQVE